MLRTLSARILISFAVLTLTFVITIATLIRNTSEVESEVDLIGNGYVKAALAAGDLELRQEAISTYLDQQIPDEKTVTAEAEHLRTRNRLRNDALDATRSAVEAVAPLTVDRDEHFYNEKLTPLLDVVRKSIDALQPAWQKAVAKPTIGVQSDVIIQLKADEKRVEAQVRSLTELLRTHLFGTDDEHPATVQALLHNQHRIRNYTVYVGAAAVMLGLFVTMWAVFNLRPLRRLRDGARRVAAGDYASRIDERGPTEVGELAREFNSMARAVQEREHELVRSERLAAVGKMAAMITHEVRNPLSSIGLNTELLVDELDADADEARSLCRSITREVDRLTAITEEYLAFARLPKPKIAREPVNAMVQALAQFVRQDLGTKQVELATDLDAGDPVALVDASQLRQCLVNLVRNATEAVSAKGKGKVTLRTRRADGRVAIEVEDDGVGIAPEVLPRLFDPFFSTKDSGSGLGLALTQQIVKDHGGDLAVASEVGRGTTFTLNLPAAS
nr:ATP-binding protein [Kofleriaceae bacterium]